MDIYLRCAMERLKTDMGYKVPYGNIHECSKARYDQCKSGQDTTCLKMLNQSAMMSYCAPLKDLPYFAWGSIGEHGVDVASPPSHGAITVLRHVRLILACMDCAVSLFRRSLTFLIF